MKRSGHIVQELNIMWLLNCHTYCILNRQNTDHVHVVLWSLVSCDSLTVMFSRCSGTLSS